MKCDINMPSFNLVQVPILPVHISMVPCIVSVHSKEARDSAVFSSIVCMFLLVSTVRGGVPTLFHPPIIMYRFNQG